MKASDIVKYRYALVILADDKNSAENYYREHRQLLDQRDLQTVFVGRSSESDCLQTAEETSIWGENVSYHTVPSDCSIDDSYNASLEWIHADFVCFSNTDVCYDYDCLQGLGNALALYPDNKIAVFNYKRAEGSFSEGKKHKKAFLIKLNDQESITLFPHAYFYSTDLIGSTRFHSACEEESAIIFLLEMLQKTEQMICVDTYAACYNEKINFDPAHFYGCMSKSYYIPSVEENYLPILQACANHGNGVPGWLQRSIVYLIFFKIFSNYNRRDRFVLLEDDKEAFFASVSRALQYVDDENLIRRMHYKKHFVPIPVVQMLVSLKYSGGGTQAIDKRFLIKDQTLYMQMAGRKLSLKNEQRIVMQAINIEREHIVFDAYFHTYALYQFAPDAVYAELNGAVLQPEPTAVFSLEKTFGISIDKKYTFRLPVKKDQLLRDGARLTFFIGLGGEKEAVPLVFAKQAARLDESCQNSFWQMEKSFILQYEKPCLCVRKMSAKELSRLEKVLLEEQLGKVPDEQDREMIRKLKERLRWGRRFGKKKVQLYFDKLYKAGDNGEYQFRYDIRHQKEDGTECYYILHPDSRYYGPLKKEFGKHILEYNSLRCRYYALRASLVFATASNVFQILGFDGQMNRFFRNSFDAEIVCLYHGITMQKIAEVQNRLLDNVRIQFVSSKYEAEQLEKDIYGYRQDQIRLTGMSRYDGLRFEDQKIILIAPTWRPYLATKLENRKERKHSEVFKTSTYFHIYNQLINDPALISSAKKNGYRIIFLLHTGMTAQKEDYDPNDFVEILRAGIDVEYEDILSMASLMVTDYSGIQYDFAYMRKPIIYYHPKELPPTYQNGGMDYESMGFGPVITEREPLVQAICDSMEQKCILQKEYLERENDFFAFQDQNNCKRIHDYIQALYADHDRSR